MKTRWNSLEHFLEDCARSFGKKNAFSLFEDGCWKVMDYETVLRASRERARALSRSGHGPGQRVAILSPSKIELPVQFFGTILAGAIAVPIDPKLSETEIESILKHLEPRTLIVSREFRQLGYDLRLRLGIEKLLLLEQEPQTALPGPDPREQPKDETAAIYYTSGTLGSAKGVMISTETFLFELTALRQLKENDENDVIFSILPMNHLYGMTGGVLYSMACGSEYVFAHSLAPQDIGFCLQERRVTQMSVVPLLLNLMRRGIQKRFSEQSLFKRTLLKLFLTVGPWLPQAARRKLFGPVHEKLGGHLRRAVSGAAPLDPATYDFFRAIGAPVFEGYGLTETGPVACVNTTRSVRKGTVGRVLPGVELKVEAGQDGKFGEILIRGPNVMQGYYKAPELTAEVITEDGWFRTGDLGRLENGFLRITGRKKSLIVLESGKKVHAEEVEQALSTGTHFQDICVLGMPSREAGEQVVAVVHPSAEFLAAAAGSPEKAASDEVARLCRKLAPFKRPARVVVQHRALSQNVERQGEAQPGPRGTAAEAANESIDSRSPSSPLLLMAHFGQSCWWTRATSASPRGSSGFDELQPARPGTGPRGPGVLPGARAWSSSPPTTGPQKVRPGDPVGLHPRLLPGRLRARPEGEPGAPLPLPPPRHRALGGWRKPAPLRHQPPPRGKHHRGVRLVRRGTACAHVPAPYTGSPAASRPTTFIALGLRPAPRHPRPRQPLPLPPVPGAFQPHRPGLPHAQFDGSSLSRFSTRGISFANGLALGPRAEPPLSRGHAGAKPCGSTRWAESPRLLRLHSPARSGTRQPPPRPTRATSGSAPIPRCWLLKAHSETHSARRPPARCSGYAGLPLPRKPPIEELKTDLGDRISAVSVALPVGGRVFLGAIYDPLVLDCPRIY
jgi:long-chain acyl-CoA synthetase